MSGVHDRTLATDWVRKTAEGYTHPLMTAGTPEAPGHSLVKLFLSV